MKRGLVPGLIFLLGLAAALHRTSSVPESRCREIRPPAEPIVEIPEPAAAIAGRDVELPLAANLPAGPETRRESPPLKRPVVEPSWIQMRPILERDLGLTGYQTQALAQALIERDQEIQACHETIRKSGIIDFQAYDREAQRMKETWYRRIDALLDTEQHVRFVALVDRGLLNEGLAFTIEPGMTVLE